MRNDLALLCCNLGYVLKLKDYKNEFETLRPLFDKCPEKLRKCIDNLPIQWFDDLELEERTEHEMKEDTERIQESNSLRRQGNALYTASGKNRDVLGACRLYNDSIFAVIGCRDKVDELSLAFANRAMALQTFGYYRQAYDDCVYALLYGYPLAMRHKLVTRQAYCALKLGDLKAVEKHVAELKEMPLNDNFQKQLKEIENDLEISKSNKTEEEVKRDDIPLNRETQEIVDSLSDKGRFMRAKCDISKNSLIFTERAPAAVPVFNKRSVCHHCLICNFIPYPCLHCRGRVVYCSRKCQVDHQAVHEHECWGYRILLFPQIGIGHIALRQILENGVISIIEHIKSESTTEDLWRSLCPGGAIASNNKIVYSETLRMVSHMNKVRKEEIAVYAVNAFILVAYLRRYSNFFTILKMETNHSIDWELIVAALILRHIGQMISNAHTLTAIGHNTTLLTTSDFPLLNEKIWSRPMHLKVGYLNSYSRYSEMAVLNLPYLSICNHSCIQSFNPRFSGRYVSTYALRDLKAGEEITNCYYIDCRKMKCSDRREVLKETYYFDCKCESCVASEQDNNFNQYHQYRCENIKCGKIFVPNIAHPSLAWWLERDKTVYCTKCGCKQNFKWYIELQELRENFINFQSRKRCYQIFKSLENILLGLSDARSYVANQLINEWFHILHYGTAMQEADYQEIVNIIKYSMECSKSLVCVNSVEYVADMVYLWDIIALGKYTKYTKTEMNEMLFATTVLADDLKEIFLNYYNDYIKEKLSHI